MKKNKLDLSINIFIVVSTILSVGYYFISGPDILGSTGAGCLKYFTTDSNILVSISSLIYVKYNIKRLKDEKVKIPRNVVLFKYVGTVAATITLVTVFVFLVPMGVLRAGVKVIPRFFEKNIFFLHFLTPVLSLISFVKLEREYTFTFKDSLFTLIPVVLYSFVYLFMVVIIQVWNDWYGFTFGGKYYLSPIVMMVMLCGNLCVSTIVRKLK